jgi:hypothetical protein
MVTESNKIFFGNQQCQFGSVSEISTAQMAGNVSKMMALPKRVIL